MKLGLSSGLEIDTDEINKNYTYGGEKGEAM